MVGDKKGKEPNVGRALLPASDGSATPDADKSVRATTPLAAPEPSAAPKPAPGFCRVSLSETARFPTYRDPQTHLLVTKVARDVPCRLVGDACRREILVIIEES